MVAIGRNLPFGPPTGEEKPRTGRMQIVNGLEQPRHSARGQDDPVEAPVSRLPRLNVRRTIAGAVGLLGLIENSHGQMRHGIAQRQHLQRGAHLGDLPDLLNAEACHTNASARLADDQALRFQKSEGLAHRHMARTEFPGNMLLPKPGAGLKGARNYALCQYLTDPHGDCIVFGCSHAA